MRKKFTFSTFEFCHLITLNSLSLNKVHLCKDFVSCLKNKPIQAIKILCICIHDKGTCYSFRCNYNVYYVLLDLDGLDSRRIGGQFLCRYRDSESLFSPDDSDNEINNPIAVQAGQSMSHNSVSITTGKVKWLYRHVILYYFIIKSAPNLSIKHSLSDILYELLQRRSFATTRCRILLHN